MTVLIKRRKVRKRPRVEIIPMIDVMFFLVVFFMLFSTFRSGPEGIHVELPRAATAEEQVASELIITVSKEGAYYLNDRLITVTGLENAVREAIEESDKIITVFRIDKEAKWDWVMTAIDTMRKAGGSSLSFEVEPI